MGAKVIHANRALLHAQPHILAFPLTGLQRANAAGFVIAPMVGHGHDLSGGRELAHVGMVGHHVLAALLHRNRHGGRAGVKGQHIGALIHQQHGGIAFARGVEPFIQPDHAHLRLGIDRAQSQRKGIDALQYLGNGKARHVTHGWAFTHAPCRHTGQIAPFVIAGIGGSDIGRTLEAGEYLEFHVGKIARHLHGRFHIAKAGGKDDLVALAGQIAQHALGIRPFGHVGHMRGLHAVAELLVHLLARQLVLVRPARFGNGRHVDPCRFGCGLCGGRCGGGGRCDGSRESKSGHERGCEVFVHGVPLHGSKGDKGCRLERNGQRSRLRDGSIGNKSTRRE